MTNQTITAIRAEIDSIDSEILNLIKTRLIKTDEIGKIKHAHSIEALDEKRELEHLSALKEKAIDSNLPPDLIESIFRLIVSESRSRQIIMQL